MQRSIKRTGADGFTIVELMVATVIFSVVLMVVTFGVLQITRTYYKGVNEASTQTVARNIIDTVGQAIQFNGGLVSTNDMVSPYVFCAGNQQFSFRPGWVVVDGTPNVSKNETPHGLYVRSSVANCTSASTTVPTLSDTGLNTGRELLAPNMRVAALRVVPAGGNTNQYRITVRIISGANDFLYSPSGNGLGAAAPDATCRGGGGATSQFCSVSELSTTVTKRVK